MISNPIDVRLEVESALHAGDPERAIRLWRDILEAVSLGLAEDPIEMAKEALPLASMLEGAVEDGAENRYADALAEETELDDEDDEDEDSDTWSDDDRPVPG